MSTATARARGASFTRKRSIRAVSSIASAGLVAGFSLAGASSAAAATDADCTVGNTVSNGLEDDVQALLDADTAIICLSGTFVLTTPLLYDYDVTIHGLVDALLDGDGVTGILVDTEADTDDNTLTVEHIRFTDGFASDGGAIHGYNVLVYNSQFDNNSAAIGGAIRAYAVDIYDSLFFDNAAGDVAGAVAADEFLRATRTTFATNTATGGGAIVSYGVMYIVASTFDENEADFGGALFSVEQIDVQNSTFVGNTADAGGAMIVGPGSVRQSTFLNNLANDEGQSIIAVDPELELRGNIFAGSTTDPHLVGEDSFVDLGANLFTTAVEPDLTPLHSTSRLALTTLALFNGATLASNGGPTQTVALHAGSPALSAVPASLDSMTVDQRGVVRPAVSDAGAYEFADVLAPTGSTPAGWLAGAAALLLAGAAALGIRSRRSAAR